MDFLFEQGISTGEVWLALHGSARDEKDMVPFVRAIAPEASVLSVRGTVTCGSGFAHFRRDSDNRPDAADLSRRSGQLETFLREHTANRPVGPGLVLCGFSNGAVMGASLLLRGKCAISAALLFRPMLPPDANSDHLKMDIPVLLVDAGNDKRRQPEDAAGLAGELRRCGARVTVHTVQAGHPPTDEDIRAASKWLRSAGRGG